MAELWLFGGLAAIALVSAAVVVSSASARTGAAALGICALAVALLCVLHGAADLGWAVALVFGGGLAPALALVATALGPRRVPGRAARWWRSGGWLAALVVASLFGTLLWSVWPAETLSPAVAEPALTPGRVALTDPLMLLAAVLLAASTAAVIVLTRRGGGSGTNIVIRERQA